MTPRAHPNHTRPEGYPADYETTVTLRDGRRVRIRPILPSDAPALANAIRTADAETLHARFLGSPPPTSTAVLDSLTRLDYTTRFAVVAFAGTRGVAVGRYVRLPPADGAKVLADVAVVVAPRWRRVGLAGVLIGLLARRAAECGISDFSAVFLPENRPVMELARGTGSSVVIGTGTAELEAPLPAFGTVGGGVEDRVDGG